MKGHVDIWTWPAVLGVLTAIGLMSGLFSEGGFGDVLAAACLTSPVAVGLWFGWFRRQGDVERCGR